ncbi:MAG: DUF1059 domain-containing protein [Gammaproteobacteria bacterium]|nr:DUF1059 domain-containing protein [Gammaproteobacteria bacterium]
MADDNVQAVHNLDNLTEEVIEKVKAAIQDE